MARQNVEQKGYGIAMHHYELKSEGRATNCYEMLGNEKPWNGAEQ
jgi:hypothetical protein